MSSFHALMSMLDLIDRADGVIGNVRYGAHHQFHIPLDGAWTGGACEELLARHGVRIWDRGLTSDTVFFSVKAEQANWAEYLLKRRGIPVVSAPVNPQNDTYAQWYAPGDEPPNWQRKAKPKPSWAGDLLSFLNPPRQPQSQAKPQPQQSWLAELFAFLKG